MPWIPKSFPNHTVKAWPQEQAYKNMDPGTIQCYLALLGIRKFALDVLVILFGLKTCTRDFFVIRFGIILDHQSIN